MVSDTTGPTYRVTGWVVDSARTALAWAEITNDLSGRYKPAATQAGMAWYMWMPKGAEKIEIVLRGE